MRTRPDFYLANEVIRPKASYKHWLPTGNSVIDKCLLSVRLLPRTLLKSSYTKQVNHKPSQAQIAPDHSPPPPPKNCPFTTLVCASIVVSNSFDKERKVTVSSQPFLHSTKLSGRTSSITVRTCVTPRNYSHKRAQSSIAAKVVRKREQKMAKDDNQLGLTGGKVCTHKGKGKKRQLGKHRRGKEFFSPR